MLNGKNGQNTLRQVTKETQRPMYEKCLTLNNQRNASKMWICE